MRPRSLLHLTLVTIVAVFSPGAASAAAADRIRLAIQKTGTVAWEMAVIRAKGLDKKAGVDLAVVELASTDAGKIAIAGGAADVIVSDWLWVARERSLGSKLTLRPYSTAVGAVMVAKDSPVHTIADLVGRKIGVAGGPLDKSWLLLQAQALREGVDLKKQAQVVYGAPPLIAEKLAQGEIDAALEFWNFCADLEGRGMRRAIDIREVERQLGAAGAPVVTGYVFDEEWAARNKALLRRFFAMTDEAKRLIATSDEAWAIVAPMIGAKEAAALSIYRQRYAQGIPETSAAEQENDARALYRVLSGIGGEQLVGPAKDMPAGVFWADAP
ncbi:MAG TPA: ABC transporter substrate-binding protein [Rhodoblastus sp.]|nr:ABC transporter substrate-binding protein [Rhodoblastus sp.]